MAPKPAFAQNAQIEHPKFGCGTVVSCDDEYVVIHFDDHGQKKFISSIVVPNLKKIDRQPPNRAKSRRPKSKKAAGSAE